ncbi:relaxase/mobilization nuclease domain-containing protein (plasmid) [Sulfitobacter faviae]|uniref:Relaxase/mobilization nuclease domain-containing protein n=1 Tax=Sulfitobacter faviae TaxID=1775881 RepID=A0ABZ0V5J3_9RHOB|nr:relaxase/mobilization nuclease domain-containing protein [Sulfitobacter faviae]WPZ23949.1 relaxase/mobilization nuclease domain-containing protein [Sulfitobacter faviae]
MALAKISRPRRAGPTARYLLQTTDHAGRERGQVAVVGSTIGKTPTVAGNFLTAIAQLRPRLQRHLYHVSISVPQTERDLSHSEWAAIGRAWCVGMGLDYYIIVLHSGHIHILASRIRSDGTAASDRWDYRRSEHLLRRIECDFDLIAAPSSHVVDMTRRSKHQRARSLREIHAIANTGTSNKDIVRRAIDEALVRAPDEAQFNAKLAEAGIDVTIEQPPDRAAYVFFGFRGRLFGRRALGQGYGLNHLVERGLQISRVKSKSANIPTPPWALCASPEGAKPRTSKHNDEAVQRLRTLGQEAQQTIESFRDRRLAAGGKPNEDVYRPGSGGEDEPPDIA